MKFSVSPFPIRLAVVMGLLLVTGSGLWAGTYVDDFNRIDSEMRDIGGEWLARGDMRISNNLLEFIVPPGTVSIEAISQTEETGHGDGVSFELGVDMFIENPNANSYMGLLFDWQDATSLYVIHYHQQKLIFSALSSGQKLATQTFPIPNVAANTWYRLVISSSERALVHFQFSKAGDKAPVLASGSIPLPDPPLTGGYAGLQAAMGDLKFDNFSLTTAP